MDKPKSSKKKKLLLTFGMLVLTLLVSVLWVGYKSNQNSDEAFAAANGWAWNEAGGYYYKTFTYDDTTLDAPSSFFSLKGWNIDNYGFKTQGSTNGSHSGTFYATGSKNLTTTNNAVLSLYPKWTKRTYYIDYSGNNTATNRYGDPVSTSCTGATSSTTCLYDTNVTLATNGYSKVGYTFKEWNTKSDGTGTAYSSGQALTKPNFTDVDNGHVTLYAIWEPITYNVVLHQNKPTDATHDIVNKASNLWTWNASAKTYTRVFRFDHDTLDAPNSVFTLVGWKHSNDKWWNTGGTNGAVSGTTYTVGAKNLTTTKGATLNLYPDWIKHKYTIVYSGNDLATNRYGDTCTSPTTGSTANTDCQYDTNVTLRTNGYAKVGYKFIGWDTRADGKGTRYSSGQALTKPNFTTVDGGSITLYAIWEPITYTVNLHQNHPFDATHDIVNKASNLWTLKTGSDTYYTRVFRYDHDKLDAPNDVFTLVGWKHTNTKWWPTGGTNGETSGTPIYTVGNTNLTTIDKATLNLYPDWIKHTYYIDYSGNNTTTNIYGDAVTTSFTGSTATTTCRYDTNVTLRTCGFSKKGYTFKEWNTKSDGSGTSYKGGQLLKKPNFTATDNGRITLYAIWEPIVYDVVFYPEIGSVLNWDNKYTPYKIPIRFDQVLDVNLPICNAGAYKFLGWARYKQTIQESTGTTTPSNEFYYSGASSIGLSANPTKKNCKIHFNPLTEQTKLYAWYNRTPIFVDVYEGQFFEGQNVPYGDLLSLVSAFDYEDDYYNLAVQAIYDLPEVNQSDIYLPLVIDSDNDFSEERGDIEIDGVPYRFNSAEWVNNGDGTYTKIATGERYYTIERKMQLEEQINMSELVIKITNISYEVKDGVVLPEDGWDSFTPSDTIDWTNETALDNNYWLDTSTSRVNKAPLANLGSNPNAYKDAVGHFNITYEVTDEGILCGGDLVIDSPITLEYTRACVIQYNNPPLLYLRGINWYEGVESGEDIASLVKNQLVLDAEDCVNNPPWWYKTVSDNTTGETPKVGYSFDNLQNSIEERGIWGVILSTYLGEDHPGVDIQGAVDTWSEGKKLADIKALKDNSSIFVGDVTCSEVYEAILSFNVELTAKDQFGKLADGSVDMSQFRGGQTIDQDPPEPNPSPDPGLEPTPDPLVQTREERSVTVFKISLDKDADMNTANVKEDVRFINRKYLDTIKEDGSYWGDSKYGYTILDEILKVKENLDGLTPNVYEGSYNGKNGNEVKITVKDYAN